jgi:hypothetical protein
MGQLVQSQNGTDTDRVYSDDTFVMLSLFKRNQAKHPIL